MLVFAGLGNPGAKYANNRHNIGFMAVDAIHHRHDFPQWSKKFNAAISLGQLSGEKVLLLKPLTYMNLSGQAVGEALRFFKLGPSALVVFHDDLDLVPGKVRIKSGGGHGGNNGLKSIDAHIGKDYRRVRIGIGHPGAKERVTGHVLGEFSKTDEDWLNPVLDALAANAGLLADGQDSSFMNKLSLAVGSTKPDRQKGQSHIRQARPAKSQVDIPQTGPMAAMLKRLFKKD
jgi:PTH1 family peptidyl-tRNA hydrolase